MYQLNFDGNKDFVYKNIVDWLEGQGNDENIDSYSKFSKTIVFSCTNWDLYSQNYENQQ